MKKLLVVVDVQNDFVDGSLGSAQAQSAVAHMAKKIRSFTGDICVTQDTHTDEYMKTQEGKFLPVVHCVDGTAGHHLNREVLDALKNVEYKTFRKDRFASIELMEYIRGGGYDEVHLIGICTDICVISNALLIKAYLPEMPLFVDASCCAGTTPQMHEKALDVMAVCQAVIEHRT
jgi:nicotinamidase-related amidase